MGPGQRLSRQTATSLWQLHSRHDSGLHDDTGTKAELLMDRKLRQTSNGLSVPEEVAGRVQKRGNSSPPPPNEILTYRDP
ncbi:hypothetical protein EYF80_046392 [Liparis tanakae]|uniref:Uncharacterized protein n=1 Tax=Liparis tanakae TaxID=230148 RepID=A0A4Z2FRT6_9TELE|nr:hypothetical protein EYF80_046392 [Liparis tanakae]